MFYALSSAPFPVEKVSEVNPDFPAADIIVCIAAGIKTDQFRPRYSPELFEYLIGCTQLGPEKKVLEIGPGTGQATEPILETGCDYNAIELGEHLYAKMRESMIGTLPSIS